jgi:hypothetical protein
MKKTEELIIEQGRPDNDEVREGMTMVIRNLRGRAS